MFSAGVLPALTCSQGVIFSAATPDTHAVIIARSLGIPVVVSGPAVEWLRSGTKIEIDGGTGRVTLALSDMWT